MCPNVHPVQNLHICLKIEGFLKPKNGGANLPVCPNFPVVPWLWRRRTPEPAQCGSAFPLLIFSSSPPPAELFALVWLPPRERSRTQRVLSTQNNRRDTGMSRRFRERVAQGGRP